MVGDPFEDLAQIELRIETVELGGSSECVDGGGAFSAVVGASEEEVFATQADGAQAAFGGVVVYFGLLAPRAKRTTSAAVFLLLGLCRSLFRSPRITPGDAERRSVRRSSSRKQSSVAQRRKALPGNKDAGLLRILAQRFQQDHSLHRKLAIDRVIPAQPLPNLPDLRRKITSNGRLTFSFAFKTSTARDSPLTTDSARDSLTLAITKNNLCRVSSTFA
jgi:hypothetical protein